MDRFNVRALHKALDEERRARNLTWTELTAQINRPFNYTTSIPIAEQTIKSMAKKRSVTSGVVLQILRWLDRTHESFLDGREQQATAGEKLPDAGPKRILRFDTTAIHAALDKERRRRGMTWAQVARELPGFTPGMLSNLKNGPPIGLRADYTYGVLW
jgi:hypothetical protein